MYVAFMRMFLWDSLTFYCVKVVLVVAMTNFHLATKSETAGSHSFTGSMIDDNDH